MHLISEIETYLADHSALDGPEARDVIRRFSLGENVELPTALTTAGVDLRNALVAALAAAQTVTEPAAALPAPAASSSPSGMTPEARKTVLEAIAPEAQYAATVSFLAASDMPIEEAAKTLRIAKEQAASAVKATGLPAGYKTIAERAADMPEMGPMHSAPMLDADARKEAVKAGWKKAIQAAQEGPTLQIGGR